MSSKKSCNLSIKKRIFEISPFEIKNRDNDTLFTVKILTAYFCFQCISMFISEIKGDNWLQVVCMLTIMIKFSETGPQINTKFHKFDFLDSNWWFFYLAVNHPIDVKLCGNNCPTEIYIFLKFEPDWSNSRLIRAQTPLSNTNGPTV